MDVMGSLVNSMKQDLSYNVDAKQRFHNAARRAFHKIAADLGLSKDGYEVRSNKGGIAVSGKVTLHADSVYIQVSESCMGQGQEILFRSCKGRKDYYGGPNNFMSVNMLTTNYQKALSSFSSVML